jgi:hypothetical protein
MPEALMKKLICATVVALAGIGCGDLTGPEYTFPPAGTYRVYGTLCGRRQERSQPASLLLRAPVR